MPSQLKIWSFPKTLEKKDKEDLLKHFGAIDVRHVTKRDRDMAVLASFKNDVDCEYALRKLHQLKVLGVRLMAIYSDNISSVTSEHPHMREKPIDPKEPSDDEKNRKIQQVISRLTSVGAKFGINHPIPMNLKYLYPPPSASIIANIAQTLVAVPKFYTQVLHLMNKMNLPVPFGQLFDISPACEEVLKLVRYIEKDKSAISGNASETVPCMKLSTDSLELSEDKLLGTLRETSESESELESDGESSSIQREKKFTPVKRKTFPQKRVNKRPKLSQLQQTLVASSRPCEPSSIKDVFEASENQGPKKLHLNLQTAILPQKEEEAEGVILQEGGFGKIESSSGADKKQPDKGSMEEWREKSKYITKEELLDNRVDKTDWPIIPVFKNYTPGEPSPKLYIKNLAKTTSEEDLKHIYGRYIFWQNDEEANLFSIRLMKEGRMKGQAFVTFPSEKQASEALDDTNGYILNDKPMVVVFGKVKKS